MKKVLHPQTRAPFPTIRRQLHLGMLAVLASNCSLIHLPQRCVRLGTTLTAQKCLGVGYCFSPLERTRTHADGHWAERRDVPAGQQIDVWTGKH